jgi:hypothetical protein
MTKQEAKGLALEKLYWYRDHDYGPLSAELFNKVSGLRNSCPLCELFYTSTSSCCCGCILPPDICRKLAKDVNVDTVAAAIDVIEAWEPEEVTG